MVFCCGLCSWTEVIWFVFFYCFCFVLFSFLLFFKLIFLLLLLLCSLYFSSGAEMSSISKGKQVLNGHFKLCNHLSKDTNHAVSTR